MTNVAKIVWHGVGAGEEFAVSTTYQLDHALTATEVNAIATALPTAIVAANKTNLLNLISTDQNYNLVSVYFYATDPRDPATLVGHAALTTFVGTGTFTNPLQLAMCVTTHSDFAGASNRGRMYFPACGVGLANHKFAAGNLTDGVNAAKGLLEAGNAAILAHSTATSAVASVFSPTKGTLQKITTVSTDNVPDTQRRRAQSLASSGIATATVVTA